MFDSLEPHRVILFPQFFWATTACLYSPHEWDYLEAVKILHKFLAVVDIGDERNINTLMQSVPLKWSGEYTGLLPLMVRGITSVNCESHCIKLINLLLGVKNGNLVHKSSAERVMLSVLANVPRILQVSILNLI